MDRHELTKFVSDNLMGKSFAEPEDTEEVQCWRFVRHMYSLIGVELPENPYRAQLSLFHEVDRPDYWDIVSFTGLFMIGKTHAGFMESPWLVLHCSESLGGVVRTDLDQFVVKPSFWRLNSRR